MVSQLITQPDNRYQHYMSFNVKLKYIRTKYVTVINNLIKAKSIVVTENISVDVRKRNIILRGEIALLNKQIWRNVAKPRKERKMKRKHRLSPRGEVFSANETLLQKIQTKAQRRRRFEKRNKSY